MTRLSLTVHLEGFTNMLLYFVFSDGTGFLVMKFIDVVREVEKMCKGDNHVFWLMENTANMQPEYKQIICRLLDVSSVFKINLIFIILWSSTFR